MSTRTSRLLDKGAGANNTRRPHGSFSADKGGATITGTGLAFVSGSTITDSGNGFTALAIGDRIVVRGSPLNSRTWEIVGKASDGQIAVRPQMVRDEAAGASITISREA